VRAEVGEREVPAWFDEGFASLFEQGRIVQGQWIYGNPNPWREKLFRSDFEAGRVPTLEQFFTLSAKAFHADVRQNMHYNVGRSLCLYLLRRRGESALRAYVRAVLDGKGGKQALESATGASLTEIETAWRTHIREVNFGGDYLARARGMDALQILQEGVRNHPDYGMLRLALAEEYLRAKQFTQAMEHAELALADPRLIEPHRAHEIFAEVFWGEKPLRAIEALEQAVALQPWLERIEENNYKNLSMLRNRLHDYDGARQAMLQLGILQREDGPASTEQRVESPPGRQ
jgi:tetratricopeptide (TPR) repeat protein